MSTMDGSDGDEELNRAIALSLQDRPISSRLPLHEKHIPSGCDIVDLDSDDHVQPNPIMALAQTQPSQSSRPVEASIAMPSATVHNFLGLNRKLMEQERLARKRRASISPPPTRKMIKASSSPPPTTGPSPVANAAVRSNQLVSIPRLGEPNLKIIADKSIAPKTTGTDPTFLDGVMKKTWALGHDRNEDIKIEEVLQTTDLKLAVLSSFQWDMEWLLSKLKKGTQMILVMQAKEDSIKRQYERETSTMANLRLCFPPMEGQVNCMHSKLMLLSYSSYLRIVVPTANLVPYDWGETGVMENMLFLIDLPRLTGGQDSASENMTLFGRELIYFLEAMGLQQKIIDSIYRFDFSKTQNLAFVHTIGGVHCGKQEPWRRTGYCGLGRAVEKLGLKTSEALSIDFITSSLGSLNMGFLSALYLASQGDDGLTEYEWRSSSARTKKGRNVQTTEDDTQLQINENFCIYYPTRDMVASSIGGTSSAGTICFQSKWYKSLSFPRGLLRDCRSRRRGLLMHNKIMFVRRQCSDETPRSTSTAWTYIGSANCTESAWGRLTKDRVSKAPKLNCRNWECGVLFPMKGASSKVPRHDEGAGPLDGLAAFEGTVPVPMIYPGEEYGAKEPWFQGKID